LVGGGQEWASVRVTPESPYFHRSYQFITLLSSPIGGSTGIDPSDEVLVVLVQGLAAKGARVYIIGRRADVLGTSARIRGAREQLGETGGGIFPVAMDVTDKESINTTVGEMEAKEGCVMISMSRFQLPLLQVLSCSRGIRLQCTAPASILVRSPCEIQT
jgi:hypothetical protein